MDVVATIITAIGSALAVGIPAYFAFRSVKAQADAQVKTAQEQADAAVRAEIEKWAIERQRIIAETGSVDIASIRGIAEAARDYALELKERVEELEAALEMERKLRRKLERKFDMFIALVRRAAPELDIDSLLAQLEAEGTSKGG